jgi:hypothetical protein
MRAWVIAVLATLVTACSEGGEVNPAPEHAVLVHLKLSASPFGTDPERERVLEFEQQLEEAMLAAGVGEFDGNEFGDGECTLYMYGPDSEALFAAIAPVLRTSPLARGATVVKRAGPPGSPEEKLQF